MSRKRYYNIICVLKLYLLCLLFGRVAKLSSPKKLDLVPKKRDSRLTTYTHETCIQGRNEVRWLHARTQLGTPEEAKSFLRVAQIF